MKLNTRILSIIIVVVLIGCGILIYNGFANNSLKTLQSLTNANILQLRSEIYSKPQSGSIDNKTSSITIIWFDGTLCSDIQKLIPTSYYPKTLQDINNGYLVSVTKQYGETAQYGTIMNYIDAYQVNYKIDIMLCNENQDGAVTLKEISNNIFLGAALPNSIEANPNDKSTYYGTPPSSEACADWIKNTLGIK